MTPRFLDVACSLALQAAQKLQTLANTPLQKERKADRSWVTNADRDSDQLIRAGLRAAFPDHAILTEESGLFGDPASPYVWVVDPLDGTKAYVKGTPGYSVMIGLLHNRHPVLGVVVDPVEGHVYDAVQGEGAYHSLNGVRQRVQVSRRREWREMPVLTSTGFPEELKNALSATFCGPWREPVNSVGIKVGFLVRQLADIYINHHGVHFWDTCAPQILLEEAGGSMTTTGGNLLAYDLEGTHRHLEPTLCTNGRRHAEVVEVLKPFRQLSCEGYQGKSASLREE